MFLILLYIMLSKCVSCIVSKNCEYVSIIAPAVLSTVCVIGIYNMQNVANDIRQQTQYGIRYTENKNKQN